MKILLISPLPPNGGGIGAVAGTLLDYSKVNQNGITWITCDTTHRFRPETSLNPWVRIITGITNSLLAVIRSWYLVNQGKPDLIHLNSSASLALLRDLLIVAMARKSGLPVVIHWHFGRIPELIQKDGWEWRLLTKVIRKSSHSIVIDEKSLVSLHQAGFLNVSYIPNPLDEEIVRQSAGLRLENGLRKPSRILYAGHIIPQKGVFELVEACAQVSDVNELILAGHYESGIRQSLEAVARHRHGGLWLRFTGPLPQNEVLRLMRTAPIFVLPSYTEGFPMVVLEAMAMGCAVVATNVGAIPQMLSADLEKPCGICIPDHSVNTLSHALKVLLDHPGEISILGENARTFVLRNFSMEIVFPAFEQVWKSVLPDKRGQITNEWIVKQNMAAL